MTLTSEDIQNQVRQALQEDIGSGDVTAQLLPADQYAQATVVTREAGVLCGKDWFDEVFHQIDEHVQINWLCDDANLIEAGQTLCTLNGLTQSLLTGERVALNFLQTMSGTATTTQQYCQAITNSKARLLDTRKTIPGLRLAQKYAVRCGGGDNHRMGLYDMILIKENHIASQGSIKAAMEKARQITNLDIEIEVESLTQLEEALASDATRILLDNFTLEELGKAVAISAGRAKLEASGNISLETINDVAMTGVDFISSGSITKHVQALDLSMKIEVIV